MPRRPACPCATTAIRYNNRANPGAGEIQIDSVRDPVLSPVTNLDYRGFDLDYPDVERVKVFQKDLAEYRDKGQDAATDLHAAWQRSHLRNRARQDRAALHAGR